MSNNTLTTLVLVLAALTALSLLLALVAFRRAAAPRRAGRGSNLPTDVRGLRDEVARLRTEAATAMRHLAVVRYDAFGDMGGRLSWSMAVLNESGDGVVVTSIHGRSDARTYAKNVTAWAGAQELSPEESEAIQQAKNRG